ARHQFGRGLQPYRAASLDRGNIVHRGCDRLGRTDYVSRASNGQRRPSNAGRLSPFGLAGGHRHHRCRNAQRRTALGGAGLCLCRPGQRHRQLGRRRVLPLSRAEGESSMIQAIHVSKRYGSKTAVDNVTVDIKKNRITSLIGPNGAGKSTLLAMMSRLAPMDDGDVLVEGRSIKAWDSTELAREITI